MRLSAALSALQKSFELKSAEPSEISLARSIKLYSVLFLLPLITSAIFKQVPWPQQPWLGLHWAGDLKMLMEYGRALLSGDDTSPGGRNPYPPLATGLGALFSLFQFQTALILLYALTIACCLVFLFSWHFYATLRSFRKQTPLVLFFTVTGLLSYGLIFELERGQFNLMAMALALSSILLLEDSKFSGNRALAIFLATVAIHLKAYPALLVGFFFLIQILRDLRRGNPRVAISTVTALIVLNVVFLLAFGGTAVEGFIIGVKRHFDDPQVWNGNHSLNSFLTTRLESAVLASFIKILIFCSSFLALFVYLARNALVNVSEISSEPILILFFLGEVLPAVSHDYKLSYLPLFMIVCVSTGTVLRGWWRTAQSFVIMTCYPLLCLPYTNLPEIFQNKFPLLIAVAFLPIVCAIFWALRIAKEIRSSKFIATVKENV